MAIQFHEKFSRSIVKAISYRTLIIISSAIITFSVIHEYEKAFTIVIVTNAANMLLYIFHERVWNVVRWGKSQKKS